MSESSMSTTMLDKEERKQIANILSKYDSLFYAIATRGEFHISKSTETASVCLNTETMQPVYLFNPDFWKNKTIYGKAFLVCHEILHFVLGHLYRNKKRDDISTIQSVFPNLSRDEIHKLINQAMDLSDNHSLLNHYGFEYEKVGYAPILCWVHTLFPSEAEAIALGDVTLAKSNISTRLNYEKYLHLLLKLKSLKKDKDKEKPKDDPSKGENSQQSDKAQGKSGNTAQTEPSDDKTDDTSDDKANENQVLDDHNGDVNKDILKEEGLDHLCPLNELDEDESKKVKEAVEDTVKSLSPESQKKILGVGKESGTGEFTFSVDTNVSVNKKWETVCKNMIASIMKMGRRRYDSFNHIPNFMRAMPNTFRLPDYKEVDRMTPDKFKLLVFVDCSGSMTEILPRLIALLNTVPRDKFEVEFCFFDTRVYPVKANAHGIYENVRIPKAGGTAFHQCEEYIQQKITHKVWDSYPDLVWMWTDGLGSVVKPQFAQRWTVFLTRTFSESAKKCLTHIKNVVKLKDFV